MINKNIISTNQISKSERHNLQIKINKPFAKSYTALIYNFHFLIKKLNIVIYGSASKPNFTDEHLYFVSFD